MGTSHLDNLKKIPRYLIPFIGKNGSPGVVKSIAKDLFGHHLEWRLFAEGCLRNRYFRNQVLRRGTKCMACSKNLRKNAKIEQHHNDYLWYCIGETLSENSTDIHRKPVGEEEPLVPDCRSCHKQNPEHFQNCIKRIYPLHAACHGHVHEKELYFRQKLENKLKRDFEDVR